MAPLLLQPINTVDRHIVVCGKQWTEFNYSRSVNLKNCAGEGRHKYVYYTVRRKCTKIVTCSHALC
jgi:hypothetical protein